MPMDVRKIKSLIDLIEKSSIVELELVEGEERVRISRSQPQSATTQAPIIIHSGGVNPSAYAQYTPPQLHGAAMQVMPSAAPLYQHASPTASPNHEPAVALAEVVAAPIPAITGQVVRSPMVGTFYRSPEPDAPPFVQEGQKVAVGDVLCIIEAMKMLNRIEAEISGVVKKIHVENSTPVQYDQPLFVIE